MTTTVDSPAAATRAPAPLAAAATATGGPAAYLRHALALAQRSLIKTWRSPEALIDVTIQPIIFLLLFTYIFGGAIAGGSQHAYLEYLLPGILGQGIATAGIALGQNLNADIEKGVFDRFRSLPIARSVPLVGAVLSDFGRYACLIVFNLVAGTILGFRFHTSFLAVVAGIGISIAFALCLCWVSVWVGLIARTSGSVQGIMFLIILPLTFGSNTFVQTQTLPGWLQAFVKVNPITHLVTTVRGLFVGGPVAAELGWTLVSMAALLVVFMPLALRAYRRKV